MQPGSGVAVIPLAAGESHGGGPQKFHFTAQRP